MYLFADGPLQAKGSWEAPNFPRTPSPLCRPRLWPMGGAHAVNGGAKNLMRAPPLKDTLTHFRCSLLSGHLGTFPTSMLWILGLPEHLETRSKGEGVQKNSQSLLREQMI